MTDIKRALVVGATGNIGRIAVGLLREQGVQVRGLARNAHGLPSGAEAISADVRDLNALRAAADDVDAVVLIWPFMSAGGIDEVAPVLARPGRRIAYVSAMHVRDDRSPDQNGVWGQVEAAIRATGADWTFLRASGFATNTLQWAPAIRAGDPVRIPYVRAARSLIHERDLAESAVAAVTSPAFAGRSYVLSGPSAVTQEEQVRLLGGVALEISADQARAAMDPGFADSALPYWASLVDNPEPVADGVRELTGHGARTFAQWATDHAADFR
ncbi:SDR family oxidoreductase [Dactylosporangium sp. CS-033363]|uniref:SDR family oxidoreductase n=1 Tax=Dactylosporangium sp. CS-033363 TaxID=3239935 RepID=UPI003D92EFE6